MVCMQNENTVHGAFQHRINPVSLAGRGEHHMQEVAGIGQIVARVDERLAERIFVAHSGHGGHFR